MAAVKNTNAVACNLKVKKSGLGDHLIRSFKWHPCPSHHLKVFTSLSGKYYTKIDNYQQLELVSSCLIIVIFLNNLTKVARLLKK